jgi:hypothetical protein
VHHQVEKSYLPTGFLSQLATINTRDIAVGEEKILVNASESHALPHNPQNFDAAPGRASRIQTLFTGKKCLMKAIMSRDVPLETRHQQRRDSLGDTI